MQIFNLRILKTIQNTKSARTIRLDTASLVPELQFLPGQFIMVHCNIEGKTYKRAYSIHSPYWEKGFIEITVKKVPAGTVSSYLNNSVKQGDSLKVSSPAGRFVIEPSPFGYKHYFFIAAGSGITPILAMIQALLHIEKKSYISLLYANRNRSETLFYTKLKSLEETYSDRFTLNLLLSQPFSDWASLTEKNAKQGRVTGKTVHHFIQKNPPCANNTRYFICGPGELNHVAEQKLKALGIPAELIYKEKFGSRSKSVDKGIKYKASSITIKQKSGVFSFKIAADETILEGLKKEAVPVQYSCEAGVCGSCKAKLVEGEVKMDTAIALGQDEVDAGKILTCQARTLSERITLTMDDA